MRGALPGTGTAAKNGCYEEYEKSQLAFVSTFPAAAAVTVDKSLGTVVRMPSYRQSKREVRGVIESNGIRSNGRKVKGRPGFGVILHIRLEVFLRGRQHEYGNGCCNSLRGICL